MTELVAGETISGRGGGLHVGVRAHFLDMLGPICEVSRQPGELEKERMPRRKMRPGRRETRPAVTCVLTRMRIK